ncbi:cytochrome-c oxidase, cbb3-type subunit III [Novimethylophilus kurashikiensis]|nr:cytochrome-c oxidase, cbb3-type subunit III [Novimethylophilus kurashikiensis]
MSQEQKSTVQTTGHVWDDDLREATNPLPNWWLWTFYITIIFAIVYWVLYPAWPIGKSFTKGMGNNISYTAKTVDGKEVQKSTHWNMRAKLMAEMNEAQAAQQKYVAKVAATPLADVPKDAELMQFVQSSGKTLFSDNCAACHQAGGQGKVGMAPNLVDDSWIYGGSYEKINETITNGRNGMMPAFHGVLTDEKITQVANYVLSLSGEPHNAEAAKAGDAIFHGEGGCLVCHGPDAKGNQDLGSANLTDKIWLWANVPAQSTPEGKLDEVRKVITAGVSRGKMPTWGGRLSAEQIKVLTVYVHDVLGGGK